MHKPQSFVSAIKLRHSEGKVKAYEITLIREKYIYGQSEEFRLRERRIIVVDVVVREQTMHEPTVKKVYGK